MPRAGRAKKPDENAIYIAWTSGSVESADGVPYNFSAGQRLRGDQPAVQHASWAFVADGTPRGEWPDTSASTVEQAEREKRFAENPFDTRVHSQPDSLTLDLAVCVKRLRVGWGRNVDGLPENIVAIEPGELFNRDEQVVEKAPSYFEPFKPDTRPKGRRR